MHLTRAISYIARMFARKSSRKCHTVRTFGLTAVTKAEEEKDDRNWRKKKRKKRALEKSECTGRRKEIVSGRYAKNLKLSRRERGKEKPMVTEPRETEAPRRTI